MLPPGEQRRRNVTSWLADRYAHKIAWLTPSLGRCACDAEVRIVATGKPEPVAGFVTYGPGTFNLCTRPGSYLCVLCGQRIDDGKPCGCGARR